MTARWRRRTFASLDKLILWAIAWLLGWRSRAFASLDKPNFRLFFIGQCISLLGTWMGGAAEAWLVFKLTNSNRMLGTVAAVSMLPLVFSPVGGGLADRFPKRRMLVVATLFNFFLALTTAILVFTGLIKVWMIVVLAILGGVILSVEMPVRQAFLIEMVGKESLLNAVALNTALFNITRMVGQGLAGPVMKLVGMSWCFLIDALSFLAVLASLLLMVLPPKAGPASQWKGFGHFFRYLREGFRYARGDPGVRTLIALLAVSMLFGLPYTSQMPAFAHELGLAELGYGLLLSVNGFGAVIGALWLAGQGAMYDRRTLVFRMQWLFGASLVALSFAPRVGLAIPAAMFAGFGMVTFFSASNALIQHEAPDALRGRVLGVWHCVFGSALPVGNVLMGFAAGAIGVRRSFAVGGAICLVFSLVAYARRPRAA